MDNNGLEISILSNSQNESIKSKIRSALGLKENECIIDGSDKDIYTVKSISEGKNLLINTIKSIDGGMGYKIYLFQLCNLTFEHCVFECEIELKETTIDKKICFKNCTFQKTISSTQVTFNKPLIFQDSSFESVVCFREETFNSKVEFSGCSFHNELDFSRSTFSQEANFMQTTFKASVYFDKVTFEGITTFKRSEFCENAHFYQTKFNEDPNFFQTMFNKYLNLTDTNIHCEDSVFTDMPIFNFEFKDLKERARTCSEVDEFRDVFNNIKNALIKSGNLLSASRFRKMELYCKEIELEYKIEKTTEKSTIQDIIDKIQLMCYRVTSDHHTDLLLILNNIVILIALFGVFIAGLEIYTGNITVENIVAKIHKPEIWETFIIALVFVTIAIYFILKLDIIKIIVVLSIFFSSFAFSYFLPAFLDLFLIFIVFSFLIYLYPFIFFRTCIVLFSYIIVLIMFVVKPSLLIPILGKLIENKNSKSCYCDDFDIFEYCLNTTSFATETLSLIYVIFLFLLLWSLQKTARKNTIVPN